MELMKQLLNPTSPCCGGLQIFQKYLRGARLSLSLLTPKSSRADPFSLVLSFRFHHKISFKINKRALLQPTKLEKTLCRQ